MEITRSEKDSIMFYQGGGKNVKLASKAQDLRDFYNAENAYMAINALLMPGADNERVRMKNERKQFDLVLLEHMDELIKIYGEMYSAMCKYTMFYEKESRYDTYRIDRMNTLSFLQSGQTQSFMSTTTNREENPDFCDKDGILLLEVSSPAEIEHLDINAVLEDESLYPKENEILYAPFVYMDKEELEMTEDELKYRDMNQEPPKAKYRLNFRLSSISAQKIELNGSEVKKIYSELLEPTALQASKQVWEAFMDGEEAEEEVLKRYVQWKEKLQTYIKLYFSNIKWDILSEKYNNADRLMRLKNDIEVYYDDAGTKRKKYEKYVEVSGVIMALLYPAATLFMALSYIEVLAPWLKALSLVTVSIGTGLLAVVQSLAWGEKLQQRTATFLELDELRLALAYEKDKTEEVINLYADRFMKIVHEDNCKGLNNSEITAGYLKRLADKAEKS